MGRISFVEDGFNTMILGEFEEDGDIGGLLAGGFTSVVGMGS